MYLDVKTARDLIKHTYIEKKIIEKPLEKEVKEAETGIVKDFKFLRGD